MIPMRVRRLYDDDGVRALYEVFGFEAMPGDPDASMAVRNKDLVKNGF